MKYAVIGIKYIKKSKKNIKEKDFKKVRPCHFLQTDDKNAANTKSPAFYSWYVHRHNSFWQIIKTRLNTHKYGKLFSPLLRKNVLS